MHPLTKYTIDRYCFRPGKATLSAIAADLHVSEAVVYARLWRAGVLRRESVKAMYHDDDAVLKAYHELRSIQAVADTLGVQFYVVRDILRRHGLTPRPRPRSTKIPESTIRSAINQLRPDVQWKDIAERLGIAPGTLWDYRRRFTSSPPKSETSPRTSPTTPAPGSTCPAGPPGLG